jgi:hypothetical protein
MLSLFSDRVLVCFPFLAPLTLIELWNWQSGELIKKIELAVDEMVDFFPLAKSSDSLVITANGLKW